MVISTFIPRLTAKLPNINKQKAKIDSTDGHISSIIYIDRIETGTGNSYFA